MGRPQQRDTARIVKCVEELFECDWQERGVGLSLFAYPSLRGRTVSELALVLTPSSVGFCVPNQECKAGENDRLEFFLSVPRNRQVFV